jgi:Protein of unknown function (DUF2911)
MISRLHLATLGLALFSLPMPALAGAELAAKPGGKIKVIHGSPVWREDFASEMKPGLNWRLGSDSATTLTTEGGMLFGDTVIFPGEYNLALVCDAPNEFGIVFHHDGTFYGGQKSEGEAKLTMKQVSGKEVSKALAIDLTKDPELKGYAFRITFGPNRLTSGFETAKAKTTKGKTGTKGFTATYLDRTDVKELKEKLESSDVLVARVERKGSNPVKLMLRGGATPRLGFVLAGETTPHGSVDGKTEQAKAAATNFQLVFSDAEGKAHAVFTVHDTTYAFDLDEKMFVDVKPRDR